MTPERWQQVKTILDAARGHPRAGREAWLDEACGGDPELRRDVESFLEHEDRLAGFIEEPAVLAGTEPAGVAGTEDPGALGAGRRVGPYRLVRLIGEGGMGAVYLAERREEFEQRVALKLVRPGLASDEMIRRFEAERQILARLDHPNIARLLDGGTAADGTPYFAMELIDGVAIDRYCDQARLATRERLELFLAVCSALQLAHQNLVIHRDLKPGNILVDAAGTPKLLDFGIAKLLQGEDGAAATRTAQGAMTLAYASPEQLKGEPIGTASDLYSLGAVLYQVLAGRLPLGLEGRSLAELTRAVCEDDPVPPSVAVGREEQIGRGDDARRLTPESVSRLRDGDPRTLRRRLAGDVDSIVMKALRKAPRERYASAEQMATDLRRHLDGLPVLARQGTVSYRAAKFVRRHRLALASVAAMVLLAAGFTVALALQLRQTERARDRSEAVSEFLIDLFQAAAPDRPAGEEPTVRELLDRGRGKLFEVSGEAGLEQEPAVRATLLLKLGEVYLKLGDYSQARGLLEEAVELFRRLGAGDPGGVPPDLAAAINDLAAVHYWTGDHARAATLYRESIDLRRRLGLDHDLIKPMNNLAAILLARGELDEARRIYGEGLALRRAALAVASPEDPDFDDRRANVATSLRSLATALYVAGELDAAEPLLREALDLRLAIYGAGSVRVAAVLGSLGRVELARGRLDAAEPLLAETLEIRRRKLGEDHLHTALAKKDLASLLIEAEGEGATARVLLNQALETIYRVRPEDDWRVAAAEGLLGAWLAGAGRLAEAEVCLRRAYETLERQRGPRTIYTQTVRRRLADLGGL